MSLSELIETTKSIALANRLQPDEEAYYNYICRQYSKLFNTPLDRVFMLDVEMVCQQVFEEQMSQLDRYENINDIIDLLESIKNPDYDIEKERKLREELHKIEIEEEERVRLGNPVHESLEPQNPIKIEQNLTKEDAIPKSGGLNMDLLNKLANDENKSGEF